MDHEVPHDDGYEKHTETDVIDPVKGSEPALEVLMVTPGHISIPFLANSAAR
jgi:hypothetical protein